MSSQQRIPTSQRRIWEAGILLVSATAVALVLAFVPPSSGISGLNGQAGTGAAQNDAVLRGHSGEFQTYVWNRSGAPIILESATPLPLSGFRTAHLRSAAVQITLGDATPKRVRGRRGNVRLHGFVLRNGGYAPINYYLYDRRAGKYADSGLAVLVRQGSTTATVNAISGAVLCVYAHRVPRHTPRCDRLLTVVLHRVNAL